MGTSVSGRAALHNPGLFDHQSAIRNPQSAILRNAFTLVELLVVIAIIGILVALLLPAIQAAREAARRMSCQNNIKNLALAVLNYENAKKALPPATKISAPATTEVFNDSSDLDAGLSWVVQILPQIEEPSLYDQFDKKNTLSAVDPAATPNHPWEAQPQVLLCPSDNARGRYYVPAPSRAGNGFKAGFSFGKGNYAAYVSPEHARSMRVFPGVMINENQSTKVITDGMSKTIMLAEVRTRDYDKDSRGAWAGAFMGGAILAYDMHSDHSPPTGQAIVTTASERRNYPYLPIAYPGVDALPPNSGPSWSNEDFIRECGDLKGAQADFMPCSPQSITRSAAAPRSNHVGGVNAAHADASVTFLNNEIDQFLMARLVSINDGQGESEGYIPK